MSDCAFCPMEKRTDWWYEDDDCIIANKPTGEPMAVLKEHTTDPTDEQLEHLHNCVEELCGGHSFQIIMDHVPNHFHAHIIEYDTHPEEVTEPL